MRLVFICYRHSDSQHIADRIHEHLAQHLPPGSVFKDVDSIPPGLDFRRVIQDAVAEVRVFVVVIGPTWLTTADPDGTPRIAKSNDFVRIEIESALKKSIPIIPVLIGGAEMPEPYQLPEVLRELSFRNALAVRPDPDFRNDLLRLLEAIKQVLGPDSVSQRANPISPELASFIEVLEHRADVLTDQMQTRREAAKRAAAKKNESAKEIEDVEDRYQAAINRFRKLHTEYVAFLRENKAQLAHDTLRQIHQLIDSYERLSPELPPLPDDPLYLVP